MASAPAAPSKWSDLLERELSALMGALDLERVLTVLVFGSVARGDADDRSDLDVLVVVEDNDARLALRDRLRDRLTLTSAPLVLTSAKLLNELSDRPSFVSHLLDEGVTIYAGAAWEALRSELAQKATDPDALEREVQNRARHLRPLSKPDRFCNSPATVLSHLFGISRSLVIARLLQEGIHEYGWRHAFRPLRRGPA